ncbi:acyl-CoA dehydrogenase family protein [Nocardia sp. 348MFTsu5.1]|uniref:acyl-CoA dehydrogenase family protein n=1 Tax=Nocardia sp. 348MFTsu5.1 TaxID=1172185 RepID=UPI00035CB9FB|nr:acyl-CoA dehydrogenase family protein [Nocardia sp. 348MFTsu5.1]
MTTFTDEQLELRSAIRRAIDASTGVRAFLQDTESDTVPHDAELWRVLSKEIGVSSLLVPSSAEGSEATFADAAIVAEELGASLSPVPFLSTVALTTSVLRLSTGAGYTSGLLHRIGMGETIATVACFDTSGSWDRSSQDLVATADSGGWSLTGSKRFVLDAGVVDVVLMAAATPDGSKLFAVETTTPGVSVAWNTSLDKTRAFGSVGVSGARAELIEFDGDVADQLEIARDMTLALLAAEQVGAAQHCLDGAVQYAKQRVQFNRKIGSFQSIKHSLVNILLKVEFARSAASEAVAAADAYLLDPGPTNRGNLGLLSAISKSVCSDAFMFAADETLHVYGGLGFTWEHDSHLYFRRAKATELMFGSPAAYREKVAQTAGLIGAR